MTPSAVQLIFHAVRFARLEFKEASQIAYGGEEGPPFPPEKELVKAQLVVELMDNYHYHPDVIRVNALVALQSAPLRYIEADVLVEASGHKPFLLFGVEAPHLYEEKQEGNLRKLFEIAAAFPADSLPAYLVYYTRRYDQGNFSRQFKTIDFRIYPAFSAWHKAGCPVQDAIPSG
ncbi:MAG: hypothetical protein HYS52_02235 [Candidatus Wildermuthbacteria bacterium]|nr:hypothetical protein [Candidatus Wildermuthbacteria bacterium]